MKVKYRDLIFIAIVLLVVGSLIFLSKWQKPPAMRATTPEHLTAKQNGQCFECHTKEKLAEMELQHKHPIKWRDEHTPCVECHKPPPEARALNLRTRQIRELADLPRRAN